MKAKRKKSLIKLAISFLKLQLAGNVLFWGTYIGFFLLERYADWPEFGALVTASILAHIAFFIVNKEWVFSDKTGQRKTRDELIRFSIFMGFNFFLNLAIIQALNVYAGISPYIGQFISGLFFTVWSFIGLRFWVFQEQRHYAIKITDAPRASHVERAE